MQFSSEISHCASQNLETHCRSVRFRVFLLGEPASFVAARSRHGVCWLDSIETAIVARNEQRLFQWLSCVERLEFESARERANFLSLTLPDLKDEQGGNELSSLLPPAEEKRTKNQQLQRHSRSSPTPSPRQANSSSAPLAIPTVDSKDDVAASLTLTRLKLVLTNHANQFKEMEIREEESKMRIRQLTSSNSMLEQSSFRADSFPLMSRVQDCALRKRS